MPNIEFKIECVEHNEGDSYGKYQVGPLESGYGTTIGNALRRVLLSSLPGAAVTAISIDGVSHEFSTIPGMNEDVTELILNIKAIRTRLLVPERRSMVLQAKADQTGPVYASDLICDSGLEISNPDLFIGTLNGKSDVHITMNVDRGVGYRDADANKDPGAEIGVIAIDSIFSPVRRVNYYKENARVGDVTDLDMLILEVETDGTLPTYDAIAYAARCLIKHLEKFIYINDILAKTDEQKDSGTTVKDETLDRPIDELNFSVRTYNCLKRANIHTLRDLVAWKESDLSNVRNLGDKSLTELKDKMKELELSFAPED